MRDVRKQAASLDTQICINKAWIFMHTADTSPRLPLHIAPSRLLPLRASWKGLASSCPGAHISFRDEMQCALKNLPAKNVCSRRGEWTKKPRWLQVQWGSQKKSTNYKIEKIQLLWKFLTYFIILSYTSNDTPTNQM